MWPLLPLRVDGSYSCSFILFYFILCSCKFTSEHFTELYYNIVQDIVIWYSLHLCQNFIPPLNNGICCARTVFTPFSAATGARLSAVPRRPRNGVFTGCPGLSISLRDGHSGAHTYVWPDVVVKEQYFRIFLVRCTWRRRALKF
jgi:hypothetical protein